MVASGRIRSDCLCHIHVDDEGFNLAEYGPAAAVKSMKWDTILAELAEETDPTSFLNRGTIKLRFAGSRSLEYNEGA